MTTHLCADFMVRFQHVPVPIRRTRLNAVGRGKAAFSTDKSMRRKKTELYSLLGDDLAQLCAVLGSSHDVAGNESLLHNEKHGGAEEPADLQSRNHAGDKQSIAIIGPVETRTSP